MALHSIQKISYKYLQASWLYWLSLPLPCYHVVSGLSFIRQVSWQNNTAHVVLLVEEKSRSSKQVFEEVEINSWMTSTNLLEEL
jgi:hypothetical protein